MLCQRYCDNYITLLLTNYSFREKKRQQNPRFTTVAYNMQPSFHLIKLTCIFDVTVIVFLSHAILEDLIDLIVVQVLTCNSKNLKTIYNYITNYINTQSEESVLKFSQQHGAIFILIVQLQALKEILVTALFLFLFHLTVDGQEFFES